MEQRKYPALTVSEKAEKSLKGGHLWVFAEEIREKSAEPKPGETVDVFSSKGKYLGSGFYNPLSKIGVRIVSKNASDRFDRAFWARRVGYAIDHRLRIMSKEDFSSCRLIFGDADGFPGITLDKFEDLLVLESMCLGSDLIKRDVYEPAIEKLKKEGFPVGALFERSEGKLRALEGMSDECGYLFKSESYSPEEPGRVTITENGIKYKVDFEKGQKTGFFLDQKYNRRAIRELSRGARVLDICTHTGAFAMNAAAGGARSVTAVDISGDCLAIARENASLNGFDNIEFVNEDMFAFLDSLLLNKERKYDLIILDPPAFTKSASTVNSAYRGYLELNTKAMRALGRGGYLASCSCSHFMRDSYFKQMLSDAANAAGVTIKQIEARKQSPDHPILWNMPETEYLKFYSMQIV